MRGKWYLPLTGLITSLVILLVAMPQGAWAQPVEVPSIGLNISPADGPEEVVDSLRILILLTVLALAPAFMIMMTSFTRIIVVLSLLRSALGFHQSPPNQVLIGLALFLTIFIMLPVWHQVNESAVQPFVNGEISQAEAQELGAGPLREFMLKQTREKDLALFVDMSGEGRPENQDDLSMAVIIPAFVISELKTAFQMGFLLYVPFLIIDMVVASTLMSMGMFMLPPVMISLPFKLLLFVMVDGWYLVVKSLVESFGG